MKVLVGFNQDEEKFARRCKRTYLVSYALCANARKNGAVRLRWQHIHDSVAIIRARKSGVKTVVTSLFLPVLAWTLKKSPPSDLAII